MSEEQSAGPLTSRQSCALLRIWSGDSGAQPEREVLDFLLGHEGTHRLDETLFAVTTIPGDPAVFDAALAWSMALCEQKGPAGPGGELRCLIAPGIVRVASDGWAELESEPVTGDPDDHSLTLEPGVYLTSRAFQTLEYPVARHGDHTLRSPSGIRLPLARVGGPLFDQPPWRNREVLGHPSAWIARVDSTRLDAVAEEPLARVVGPAGAGKTRLLAEGLRQREIRHLFLTTRPERIGGPTLADQLLRKLLLPTPTQRLDALHPRLSREFDRDQIREALERRHSTDRQREVLNERALATLGHLSLTDGPVTFVIDDFQSARGHDLRLAEELAVRSGEGAVRLLFVARAGVDWSARLEATPRLEIGPLGDGEIARLNGQLSQGFALPTEFADRFLESIAGNPFALEEGLFALVHDKSLRRVYGSFFFAGDTDRSFVPSQRYIRQIDAEIGRLTDVWPPRLLALLESAAPPGELAAAATEISGEGGNPDWHVPLTRAGILASAPSPWGEGVSLAAESDRVALAAILSETERPQLRNLAGRTLASAATTGEALWLSYGLLAGTPEATEPLLALFAGGDLARVPADGLLAALGDELATLREHGGDPQVELELLWRLLPLARKMGRLRNYPEELRRAVGLATADPPRLLALASLKAEIDQESGRHQEAEATIKQALEAAAEADPKRKALLLIQLGRLLIRRRRPAEARQLFSSVREVVGASGSNPLAATCDFYLGNIALSEGLLDEARERHLAALKERERPGLERPAGSSLSALGAVEIAAGDYPSALAYYRRAEEILASHGKPGEISYALLGEARTLNRLGDFTGATRPVRQALELREGRDDTVGEALARLAVAQNYLDIGQSDAALEQARKAHFQLNLISANEHLADADSLLGRIHLSRRRYDQAKRRLEASHKAHTETGDAAVAAFDLAGLLEIGLTQKDMPAVRKHTTDLKNLLPELPSSDLSDTLSYRLYLGLDFLTATGLKVGNPLVYLDRAYRGVLEKAEHLSHEQRQRYLFQLPDNQAILAAATEKGLAAAG